MTTTTNREQAKIKNMLLISMILVPLAIMVLILGIGYYYFTTSIERTTTESMKRIITDHGRMIERFLFERQADLELLLNTYSFDELAEPDNLERIFIALQQRSPAFGDLGIFDERGLHLAYQGPYHLAGILYKDAEWFKQVMEYGTYVSDVFLGYRNVPHFIIAITRQEGERRWVIRATIDSFFFNELVKNVRIGRTGEAYIMNSHGVLQTDRRSGGNLMEPSPDHFLMPQVDHGLHYFVSPDESGLKYIYFTMDLKNGQWRMVVRQEVADAFSAMRTAGYLILLTLVVGGAGIILLAISLTQVILRRMQAAEQNQQQLNAQLVRATRLAELGQMAAGVAHEINNPLQIIKSEYALIEMNMEELKADGTLPPSETLAEIEDGFAQIKKQVSRCADITQSVLKFGRQTTPRIEPMHLQSFIPDVLHMVAKKAEVHGIRVAEKLAENLPPVNADASQLQQVLLNLFNNAMDAILEQHGVEGGLLEVTAQADGDAEVVIRVSDNGAGISPENLSKVFTPFFSTKPVGKGTGLGLSVCYGIVDSLGGHMEVESQKNEGTTFLIHLPQAGAVG
ncbi:sensor histidine kinase [Desulfatitalea alkaliphila]|uniref:histidine kinase n=1 Tax=Desulfatitalea alkaliphila TaxID=2929485 RepID=A0AA41R144_9BACT|nr:PAS domain-containing sensor histidine kinase [Desulfatitalea alkaliphila]MCJ8500242.1 ATP-binding protein [Desulfatitalea alkaliphila]